MAQEIYGANIASDRPGLAAGDAQIYDTSKLEKQLSDQIALERRRQDLQNQANLESLNKIDVNGVRAADQKDVQAKFQQAYQNFRKLQLAQLNGDRKGAVQAQADLDRSKSDVMSFIGQSKDENQKNALQYADIIHNRSSYVPDAAKRMNDLMNTPSSDATYRDKSDISQFMKEAPKVDLGSIQDKNASLSTVESPNQVVSDSGHKFDTTTKKLSFPLLAKHDELDYVQTPDIKERMDEVYDPSVFDKQNPGRRQQMEDQLNQAYPGNNIKLNNAHIIAAADYYLSNGVHYNSETRKQVTEHVPRVGATVINFGNGDGTTPQSPITVAVPNGTKAVTTTQGGKKITTQVPSVEQKNSTPQGSFTFPSMRVDLANSTDIRDASKGTKLNGVGVQTLVGSQLAIHPVYKTGPMAGNIIPDDDVDKAKADGNATYRLMFHANQGNNVGMNADGSAVILSKDPTPTYLPANNSIVNVLLQKTSKDKQAAVGKQISSLYAKVSQLNSGIQTSKPKATGLSHHKIEY